MIQAASPLRTPEDEVLSRDENNLYGSLEWKKVEETFVRAGTIISVHVSGKIIKTTAEHPFWVYNKGWRVAGELQVGDLLSSHDGQWTAVEDLLDTGEYETVYNLRVAEFHTYFVGDETWTFRGQSCKKESAGFGSFKPGTL